MRRNSVYLLVSTYIYTSPLACYLTPLAGPQSPLYGPHIPLAGPQTPLASLQATLAGNQILWLVHEDMDGQTDTWTKFLLILQDFVHCWGRCPATL